MTNDRRLIEDYLPIEAISKEASREKSARKGHISTLHLWWARRPLVACRAAVYGALTEVKGRVHRRPAFIPRDERHKAAHLADAYWLYVVWDPLPEASNPPTIQNSAAKLDHAKREILPLRLFQILAEAVLAARRSVDDRS